MKYRSLQSMDAPFRTTLALVAALGLLSPSPRASGQETPTPSATPAPSKKPAAKKPPKISPAEAARRRTEAELQELRELVARQQELLAAQKEALDAQAETNRDLNERLVRLETVARASLDRLAELEHEKPQPDLPSAVEERLRKLEADVQKLPEAADVVSVGDFPGSFRIPGTDAALKIGGRVQMTLVHSFDAIGTDDRFVTSSIPAEGSNESGKGARTTLSAAPSRFNFDFRTPTGLGAMRAFIEGGFSGPNGTMSFRHAFGQWGRLILGQTWSTFSDPEAEPFGIDFEGLNAISLFRQPQARYTVPVTETLAFAAAIENPAPDVTNANGVNQIPDVVLRLRWAPGKAIGALPVLGRVGHVQLAGLFRQIRAESDLNPNQVVGKGGYGLGLSGRLRTGWWAPTDDVTFAGYAGSGIGRYITDLRAAGGQDGYFDLATGELTTLSVAAAYVGYEHSWSKALRSTVTLGTVRVDVLDNQPGDALKYTQRLSLNLAWTPIPRLDLVVEGLAGRRVDKDLRSGNATQLQVGSRFRF